MMHISLTAKMISWLLPIIFILGCVVHHKDFTYKENDLPFPGTRLNYGGGYVHPFTDSVWYAVQNGRRWAVNKSMVTVRSDSAVMADSALFMLHHLIGHVIDFHPVYYRRETEKGVRVIFFYRDGSFECDAVNYENTENAKKYYKTAPREYLYKGYHLQWGRYIIEGDTIKTQFFFPSNYGSKAVAEHWYLLNADSSVSLIRVVCKWCKKHKDFLKEGVVDIIPEKKFSFISFPEKPDSACWLRDKKWYRN
jgi:hypothetical protein